MPKRIKAKEIMRIVDEKCKELEKELGLNFDCVRAYYYWKLLCKEFPELRGALHDKWESGKI